MATTRAAEIKSQFVIKFLLLVAMKTRYTPRSRGVTAFLMLKIVFSLSVP